MLIRRRYMLLAVICMLFSLSSFAGGNSGPKGSFAVNGHHESGDKLVFSYYAPYPGMTKVKLYDASGALIWRGQYIDPEGDNVIRLRAASLERGVAYKFEFEYKLESVAVEVTLP